MTLPARLRLRIPLLVATATLVAGSAMAIDSTDAAAIGDPAVVDAVRAEELARRIEWVDSGEAPVPDDETLDWEGGGVVSGAGTAPGGGYSPSRADAARGYAVFPWHYMVRMLPHSRPKPSRGRPTVALSATPGEYETAAVGVLALEQIKGVNASVSDLDGGRIGTIPSSAINVRWVNYVPQRLGRGRPDRWGLGPAILTPLRPIDLPKDCACELWMTVKVPEDAQPGIYRGQVEIEAEGREGVSLPLTLTVRDLELGPADPIVYAHYYNVPDDQKQMIAEMKTAKEYGSNSFTTMEILHGVARADRDGHVTQVDFSKADRFMAEFKRLDFKGPVPLMDLRVQGRGGRDPVKSSSGEIFLLREDRHDLGGDQFFRCMREMVTLVRDHAAEAGWPEVYMYASSELSRYQDTHGALIRFGLRLIQEMKSVADVKVCASINGPDNPRFVKYPGPGELSFLPHLDMVMYNYGVPISDRTINEAYKHKGLILWFQNVGMGRFTEGFMLWRAGAVGRRQYKLDGNLTDEGFVRDAGMFYRFGELILPTTDWECMREGVDDMRYIRTLERMIKEAKESDDRRLASLAERAEKQMDRIRKSIKIDMSRASVKEGDRPGLKSLELYDEYRDEFAKHIEQIRAYQARLAR